MLQNRIECQLRKPCDPRTAREWAHCIVRHTAGKPPEQIAAETGIPLKRLMKISAPQAEANARVAELAAITRVTGRYDWLRFHAREAGCEVFPLPIFDGRDVDREVLEHTTDSLRSLSGAFEKLREITRDRQIEPTERDEYDQLHGLHVAAVTRLQAWVHGMSRAPSEMETRRGGRAAAGGESGNHRP